MTPPDAVRDELAHTVANHPVVLFMKGKRRLPQCGFSAQVVKILDEFLDDYQTVNVLENPEVREGIKALSSWPTIPQLYVDGKFIGGCDIVSQMYQQGELAPLLGVELPEVDAPRVTATPEAINALSQAKAQEGLEGEVRISIDAQFRPSLGIDQPGPNDFVVEAGPMRFVLDRMSAARANGIRVDFVLGQAGGFRIENPNEPPKVRSMNVQELARRLKQGEDLRVVDVRTEEERKTASIPGTLHFDEALEAELAELPVETPIVFHCHHGQRSRQAAQRFAERGFWRVYNLDGGIDAWSQQVDAEVPRY